MKENDNLASASYWNAAEDDLLAWYVETKGWLVGQLMMDKHPPFTEQLTPKEQYDLLNAWMQANDPRFTQDPMAQQTLAKLSAQFGPPPPPSFGALGVALTSGFQPNIMRPQRVN